MRAHHLEEGVIEVRLDRGVVFHGKTRQQHAVFVRQHLPLFQRNPQPEAVEIESDDHRDEFQILRRFNLEVEQQGRIIESHVRFLLFGGQRAMPV